MEPEIPTSSMADIAFLLIVFFMLTTVFSANKGMTHVLPKDSETEAEANPAVLIKVFPSGDFLMDGTHYGAHQSANVYDYVMGKLQINSRKPVILLTDREATYGQMIKVLDQLKLVEQRMGDNFKLDLTLPTKNERMLYANALQ
jgi:biopolymer transport protein ExbD